MNINATEELIRELGEIDAKIKHLENSPNRTFVLVEYETIHSFHFFNLCFKQFWDEFDRHSASQLLLYKKIIKKHTELSDRYVDLFREQLDYLESVIDFDHECIKELPPVIFSEDNSTDVIGFYQENFKDLKDEDGKQFYEIVLDSQSNYEVIDGKDVPIDFYKFQSDRINDGHFKGLVGMYRCLENIFSLMCIVCSYPNELTSIYKPNQDEIICALENELRHYANEIGRNVERELKKTAQSLKPYRNAPLTPDVWGQVMQEEDDLFDLAIKGKLEENTEKRFEHIFEAQRKQWTENYPLLQKIKTTCLDGELFDVKLAVETHQLLTSLNANNLDLFYELVLRRNIIQREMFPDELGAKYEEWANPSEEQQVEESSETGMIAARQSKLDEIIGILQRGNWKQPATADNVKLLLETLFGRDTSLLDDNDATECEKIWAFAERGGGDRSIIVPAKLAGFFRSENLIIGGPKAISDDLFGKNNNQVNAINKGKQGCSNDFDAVIPFLTKYINKIIRQV